MIKKKPAAAENRKPAAKSPTKPASKTTKKTAAKPSATPATKRTPKSAAKTVVRSPAAAQGKAPKPSPVKKMQDAAVPAAATISLPAMVLADGAPMNGAGMNGAGLDTREKARKPKLVRDSFTMPEAEYAVLGEVKKACLRAGYEVKKSELLRVGVGLLRDMDIVALKDILAALPPLKAGRPKKS